MRLIRLFLYLILRQVDLDRRQGILQLIHLARPRRSRPTIGAETPAFVIIQANAISSILHPALLRDLARLQTFP